MPFAELAQREKLSVQVSRQIEQAILEARFAPDSLLPSEAELCRSFGVSRTVIREALQQLKARGMVRSKPGSGSYVSAVSLGDLERCLEQLSRRSVEARAFLELLDLRLLIEVELVSRVAAAPSEKLLKALSQALVVMKKSYLDHEAFAAADHAFHAAIMDGAEHQLFSAILKPLSPLGHSYRLETYDSRATLEQVVREHTEIYRGIQAKNGERARRAMTAHLSHSREHFLALQASTVPTARAGSRQAPPKKQTRKRA